MNVGRPCGSKDSLTTCTGNVPHGTSAHGRCFSQTGRSRRGHVTHFLQCFIHLLDDHFHLRFHLIDPPFHSVKFRDFLWFARFVNWPTRPWPNRCHYLCTWCPSVRHKNKNALQGPQKNMRYNGHDTWIEWKPIARGLVGHLKFARVDNKFLYSLCKLFFAHLLGLRLA